MNPSELYSTLNRELENIKEAKTFKYEVPLESEQGGEVIVEGHKVVMLASNNYLGLANHPRIKEAAIRSVDDHDLLLNGQWLILSLLEHLRQALTAINTTLGNLIQV